jgi:spermidine/putrescine-binding protein
VNKIQANKKNPVLHVGYLGPSQGTRLYEQGLLVPTEEYVTDDKIPDSFVKPGITASLLSPFGIGYNTDEVDKEITSWEDLLDPAFKGKVGIPAWGWMGNSWIYAVSKALGGSESNLKPGWDFIKKLVNENDAVICPNTDQTNKLFKTGDIVIAPFWSARTDNLTINYDIPTKFVYPEEGTLSFFFGWPIVKGHPEQERKAAEQYVTEYTHDAKRQAVYTNQSGYPYTNPDAKQHVKDEVLEKHPSLDITEANQKSLQALNLNWAKTFENREEVSSKWRRIVKG